MTAKRSHFWKRSMQNETMQRSQLRYAGELLDQRQEPFRGWFQAAGRYSGQHSDRWENQLSRYSVRKIEPLQTATVQKQESALNAEGSSCTPTSASSANGIPPFGHRTRLCEQHQKPLCRRLFHFIRSGAAHITPLRRSFLIIQRRWSAYALHRLVCFRYSERRAYTTPCAIMASATFRNPAMLAPIT